VDFAFVRPPIRLESYCLGAGIDLLP